MADLADRLEGAARNITAANPAYDGGPKYSPDGRSIAYRMQRQPGYESDLFRLALYDRAADTRGADGNFRDWVEDYEWADDVKAIYFTGPVEGQTPIYRLDIATRSITQVLADKTILGFDIDGESPGLCAQLRRRAG